MPRWSLPAAVDVDLLIEEAHVWDHIAAVPLDQHDSLPDTFSHNLEERSATLALDKAAEWMREGKLNTSEGNLNIKQSIALMVVASWIQDVLEFSWLSTPGPLPALHFILQGGPGTGKTWCSKTSRALILFFLGEGTTLQAAFMHSVSRLNAGSTLHSILKIPVGLFTGKTRTLGEKKEEYIALWRRVLALLLDEFSMISSELWYRSSFRCKQVKQQPDMPWGGLTVIATGDFHQKPPVQSSSLADEIELPLQPTALTETSPTEACAPAILEAYEGRQNWLNFKSCIFLTYSRRCKGPLCDILTEMMHPDGKLSDGSWKRLQGAVIGFTFDAETNAVRKIPPYSSDPRFKHAPFSTRTYITGVMRHSVRAALAVLQAKEHAQRAYQQLHVCVSQMIAQTVVHRKTEFQDTCIRDSWPYAIPL